MSNYSTLTETIVRETEAREEALPLLYENCRSRFFLHSRPTKKVCLFFHGFTATPEQFVPLGEVLFKAGYNVLIPLQPGHGIAGNWDKKNPPPLPDNGQTYQEFGLYWLKIAREMGESAIVGGLSSGGTLAAWLALECPELIDRSLLFAPCLSGPNILVNFGVRFLKIYFEWKTQMGREHFGYKGFFMSDLKVFLEMGDEVIERAKKHWAAPMLIVSSQSDSAVGIKEHETLFKWAFKYQPKSRYYCFNKSLNIPHTMMTKAEGNNHLDLPIAIAKAYIESNLTRWEIEEIDAGVRQGYSFNAAIAPLNLSQRVAHEIPAKIGVEPLLQLKRSP